MKKRISIKVEFCAFAVLSLIIGILVSMFLKDHVEFLIKSNEEKIKYVYEKRITYIEDELKKIDINDKSNYEKISKLINYRLLYNFYVVDKNGEVVASNENGVKRIDNKYIKDGERKVNILENCNDNISQVIVCNYIKDGYYLYFTYKGYTKSDSYMIINIIIIFIIIFTLLILGRLRYILNIKRAIKIITQGDLSYRVPLKYNNEFTELAENINFMASKLQKEDEKRKEFLTNISHDLRTPLTTTLGYLNMINEAKYDNEEELKNYIDKINKKSLFLKSMLDDFFQYSKLNSNDIKINKEDICIQELIRQIVEEEEIIFKQNNLELLINLKEEPINIKGDGELLVRAVENVLSNALKYSKESTKVGVKLHKEKMEGEIYAVITVNNTPKEFIDEKEVERFLERLYKKDKSRSEKGSGLGLSIVEEILKIHNGFIKGYKDDEKIVFKLFILI